MPTAPPTRCAEPGCYKLVTKGRCPDHQRTPWAGRPSLAERYGISAGRLRTLKRLVTARDNGCCYRCGAEPPDDPEAPGHVLDHITPISEGGSAEDLDNLGLLCGPCNEIKSKAEAARGNARRRRPR